MIIHHDQSHLLNIDEYELVIDLVEELLDAIKAAILLDWKISPSEAVSIFFAVSIFSFFCCVLLNTGIFYYKGLVS